MPVLISGVLASKPVDIHDLVSIQIGRFDAGIHDVDLLDLSNWPGFFAAGQFLVLCRTVVGGEGVENLLGGGSIWRPRRRRPRIR